MRRRTAHGVRLLNAGRAAHILMSGGARKSKGAVEAEVMSALAHAAGVPDDRIVLEDRSLTTMENARLSARVMAARGWRTALVVTDAVHLPRALLSFRAAGVRARGYAVWDGWRDERLAAMLGYVAYELTGISWYLLLILCGRHRT